MTTSCPSLTGRSLSQQVERLAQTLRDRQARLVTAESCTGGWLGKVLTDISGSSDWYLGGWITYSNEMKRRLLGVSEAVLQQYGAVHEETARWMAEGALRHSDATDAIAITGVAGPTGGTPEKPVGLVCFALASPSGVRVSRQQFAGDRADVRRQAVQYAVEELLRSH